MRRVEPAVQREYTCVTCGGAVRSHHESFKLMVPARDERGQYVFEYVTDKQTGVKTWKQKLVEVNARGLGKWACVGVCRARPTKVKVQLRRAPASTARSSAAA